MRTRISVAVLTAALVVYFVLLGERAVQMIQTGTLVGIGLGIGILLMPIVGAVLVGFELRFGWQTQVLAKRLAAEDALPDDAALPRRPSGRVPREAADAYFETVKAEVEAAPMDWRGWYALARAYDLAGDRSRAREAMRHAIDLSR